MTLGTSKGARRNRSHRAYLWEKQHGLCALCGGRMLPHGQEEDSATLDHIIPKRQRGPNALSNLQLAHRWCNEERGRIEVGIKRRLTPPRSPWIAVETFNERSNVT